MTDWLAWHERYQDPGSSISRRLPEVRYGIGLALDALSGRPELRIVSLCAGDGRDLLPELASRGHLAHRTLLMERDATLAARARTRAVQLRLDSVEVLEADAGETAWLRPRLPLDLRLLCGIFGNIAVEDIEATVGALPRLLAPGGFTIWTRGRRDREPDLRARICRWFKEVGLEEVRFSGAPEEYGVGVERLPPGATGAGPPPARLFTF